MIVVTDEQRMLLIEYVPDAEKLLQSGDVNDLLTELDDVIIGKGMDKQYELNEHGRRLQRVYDEIFNQND